MPAHTRISDLEGAIRSVCEPVFQKPLGEISFGQLLVYLFQTARRFDMEVQPSLVLLQKTLLNIEGLGRELYPELDLWSTAKPFLKDWIKHRYSPRTLLRQTRYHLPAFLEYLPRLPELLVDNLQREDQTPVVEAQRQQIEALERQVRRQGWYVWTAILGMGALLAAVVWLPDV